MNLLEADHNQATSGKSSNWLQAMQNLTTWKSFWATSLIKQSSWTANSINSSIHINNNSCQKSHLNKTGWKSASIPQYLTLPKHHSPTSQFQPSMINANGCTGCCQCSMESGRWKENVYTEGHWNILHAGACNIHTLTCLKQLLFLIPENKSSAWASLLISHLKQSPPSLGIIPSRRGWMCHEFDCSNWVWGC
jgi:hypothetical protein